MSVNYLGFSIKKDHLKDLIGAMAATLRLSQKGDPRDALLILACLSEAVEIIARGVLDEPDDFHSGWSKLPDTIPRQAIALAALSKFSALAKASDMEQIARALRELLEVSIATHKEEQRAAA